MKEYALYVDGDCVCIGSLIDIAAFLDEELEHVKYLATPSNRRRVDSRSKKGGKLVIPIEEGDE